VGKGRGAIHGDRTLRHIGRADRRPDFRLPSSGGETSGRCAGLFSLHLSFSQKRLRDSVFVRVSTSIRSVDTCLRLRVTNDHGCCLVVGILAKFLPNNQNQPVTGCSIFEFAGGEKFSGFGASGRDQPLRSRPRPPVVTKARQTQATLACGGWGVMATITMG
jgi:hypothetical protein